MLYAHTPRKGGTEWHGLNAHLQSVAHMAERFADKFGCPAIGHALGLSHDLAKADPRFQAYLQACHEGTPATKCPHSAPSALAAKTELGCFALAVFGHHGGIPDKVHVNGIENDADEKSVRAAKHFIDAFGGIAPVKGILPSWADDRFAVEFLIRMTFSCLVDADFLDTEVHFKPWQGVKRGNSVSLGELKQKLDQHLSGFHGKQGVVNNTRAEILGACRKAAEGSPGMYRLTVPTGGGKTLSGLAFAIDHAIQNEQDRIIVAIPYTSIIDQTAQVYKAALGEDAVLEHHSALEFDVGEDGQSETEFRRRLNTENWDSPLIVTTTVQLFESLLHNRPSRCRKLHNIARSVIILDEVQTLPPKTLQPILSVLNELVAHYGCTVVFCTATQLDYSALGSAGAVIWDATEIVPNYAEHFAALKRVRYQVEREPWSLETAVSEITAHRQVLAVFNTRKDALQVAMGVRELDRALGPDGTLFHLSTLMCGHHRKEVITNVREALQNSQPITLISTQVVEAGVDLDFPVVFRDLGPLDRIIQVAGRCNREGTLEQGVCTVFQLEGGSKPQGAYATAVGETKTLLDEYGENLDCPKALTTFSRNVFGHTDTGANFQKLREERMFETLAKTFSLIDDSTTALIVQSYPFADVAAIVADWNANPPGWFRRVGPFTVNVYDRDLARLRQNGFVADHESGALIYTGPYDEVFGLGGDLIDPADLITGV